MKKRSKHDQRGPERKSPGEMPHRRTSKREGTGEAERSGTQHPTEGILTKEEELKLTLAAGMAKHPGPFAEEDISPVFEWARHTRAGEVLLELTLAGHVLPVGLKEDCEIGFRPVPGVLSPSGEKRYQAYVKKTPVGERVRYEEVLKGKPGECLPPPLTSTLESRLRTAVRAGRQRGSASLVEAKHMLDFAQEVVVETGVLYGVLDGHLLPVADPDGDGVRFQYTNDLAPDDREGYLAKLKGIEQQCADSSPRR